MCAYERSEMTTGNGGGGEQESDESKRVIEIDEIDRNRGHHFSSARVCSKASCGGMAG
jgi:hypothetical protein